jgi:hypothetical protein
MFHHIVHFRHFSAERNRPQIERGGPDPPMNLWSDQRKKCLIPRATRMKDEQNCERGRRCSGKERRRRMQLHNKVVILPEKFWGVFAGQRVLNFGSHGQSSHTFMFALPQLQKEQCKRKWTTATKGCAFLRGRMTTLNTWGSSKRWSGEGGL